MYKNIIRGVAVFALLALVSVPHTSQAFWKNFEVSISPFTQAVQQVGAVLGSVSSLTEPQIQSIVALLQSFGADQTTITNVEGALRGSTEGEVSSSPMNIIFESPSDGLGYWVGEAMPVSVRYVRAPKNSQVILSFSHTLVGTTTSRIDAGGSWQSGEIFGEGLVSYRWPIGESFLGKAGIYQLSAKLAACNPLGCSYPNPKPKTVYRTTNPLSIGIYDSVSSTTQKSMLSISTDATSPSYKLIAAGATDETIGVYRISSLGENISVKSISLDLTSGASADLQSISLWNGETKIGETAFVGANDFVKVTLSQLLTVHKDSSVAVTAKANFSQIGVGQPVMASGSLIQVNAVGASGVGSQSGSTISSFGSSVVAGVRVMKAYPVVGLMDLPSTGLQDGRLLRFKVNAEHGPISLGSVSLRFAGLPANTNGQVDLYGYTDANYSSPISGFTSGGITGLVVTSATPGGNLNFPTPVHIPTGATRYFEVRDSTKGTGVTNTTALVTTLLGQPSFPGSGFAGLSTFASFFTGKEYAFIWSPNSLNTPVFETADWTSGQNVPGLPPSGLNQTRTGTTGTTTPTLKTPTINLSASPTTITKGAKTTFTWSTTNATRCVAWAGGLQLSVGLSGSYSYAPAETATYRLWCTNEDGSGKDGPSAEKSVTVTVTAPVAVAPTCTLAATATNAPVGTTTTLKWTSTNASTLLINQNVGSVSPVSSGSKTITLPLIAGTRTYTATATGSGGSKTCSVVITTYVSGGTSPDPTKSLD